MFSIKKISGEKEEFNIKKFRRSLQSAGTPLKMINSIITEIERQKPRTTKKIHELTIAMLEKEKPPVAARYNLKRALVELGPAGFPFERFIAELFKAQGYTTSVGNVFFGFCIDHEVDILLKKDNHHYMVECKFHNSLTLKSDVKVALYIHARFQDLKKAWEKDPNHRQAIHQAWIITNTNFTSVAEQYAHCVDIKMLSWKRPHGQSLAELIDKFGLHPITSLTYLSREQKKRFIKEGFVLCRDAGKQQKLLKHMGFSDKKIKKIITEAQAVCKL